MKFSKAATAVTAAISALVINFSCSPPLQAATSSSERALAEKRLAQKSCAPQPLAIGLAKSFPSDFAGAIYTWSKPNVQPQAVVLALHGGAMHGGSFRHLGEKLAQRDYLVVSLDMRGFGKSFYCGSKRDGKLNYRQTVADIHELIGCLRRAYPGTPIFCLGESLGANAALVIAGDTPQLIDGVIAISPFAAPRFFLYPAMGVHLVQFLLYPPKRLNMSYYLKRRLSNDRSIGMEQVNDPLSRQRLSLYELGRNWVFNLKGKRLSREIPHDMPVLFVVGEDDGLCKVKATKRMFAEIPSTEKELIVFENCGHLLVETSKIRPDILSSIDTWLDARTRAQSKVAGKPAESRSRKKQHAALSTQQKDSRL